MPESRLLGRKGRCWWQKSSNYCETPCEKLRNISEWAVHYQLDSSSDRRWMGQKADG